MVYSEGFKVRVKKDLPDDKELHRLLNEGDERVGEYLITSIKELFTLEDFESETCEELENKGKEIYLRAKLHTEWRKQFNE